MFIGCSNWAHTEMLYTHCNWLGEKGWKMLSIFIIDFFMQFSVSRSTPPSCCFLCPWHIVRVAFSLPHPQPLSSQYPSRCSVLAPSVSCHVKLSSRSRQDSRVSKRSVNYPGWRWHAINNPYTQTCGILLLDQKGRFFWGCIGIGHQLVDTAAML